MTLNNERLEAIRKRAEAATEGPWHVGKNEYRGYNGWVSETQVVNDRDSVTSEIYEKSDAIFIAHAREDVPALLAEIDRLKNSRTRFKDEVWRLRLALEKIVGGEAYSLGDAFRIAKEALEDDEA